MQYNDNVNVLNHTYYKFQCGRHRNIKLVRVSNSQILNVFSVFQNTVNKCLSFSLSVSFSLSMFKGVGICLFSSPGGFLHMQTTDVCICTVKVYTPTWELKYLQIRFLLAHGGWGDWGPVRREEEKEGVALKVRAQVLRKLVPRKFDPCPLFPKKVIIQSTM